MKGRKIQSKAPLAPWCLGVCTWANRADFLKNSGRGRKDEERGGVRVLWYSNSVPLRVSHCRLQRRSTTSTHGDGHRPAVTAGCMMAAQTLRRWDPWLILLTYRPVSPCVSPSCPPCRSLLYRYFVRSSIFIISSDHLFFPSLSALLCGFSIVSNSLYSRAALCKYFYHINMNNSCPIRNVSHSIILSKHLFFYDALCLHVCNLGLWHGV